MIHVIHVGADIRELNAWYENVFGGLVYLGLDEPTYLAAEKRWASLLMVSDFCVETVAPELPADDATAFGRFYARHGQRLHSVGFVSEDVEGLAANLEERGIRCALQRANGRTWFFPRPRDIGGLIIEFIDDLVPEDPRLREEWSSLRQLMSTHPLGVESLSHVTIGARDRSASHQTFTHLWTAETLEDTEDPSRGRASSWLALGDTVIELAQPTDDTTALAKSVAAGDNSVYSVTFKVADLDRARAHLEAHSIGVDSDGEVLRADPADCHGARYEFTTEQVAR
jgi:hypothetical protein